MKRGGKWLTNLYKREEIVVVWGVRFYRKVLYVETSLELLYGFNGYHFRVRYNRLKKITSLIWRLIGRCIRWESILVLVNEKLSLERCSRECNCNRRWDVFIQSLDMYGYKWVQVELVYWLRDLTWFSVHIPSLIFSLLLFFARSYRGFWLFRKENRIQDQIREIHTEVNHKCRGDPSFMIIIVGLKCQSFVFVSLFHWTGLNVFTHHLDTKFGSVRELILQYTTEQFLFLENFLIGSSYCCVYRLQILVLPWFYFLQIWTRSDRI